MTMQLANPYESYKLTICINHTDWQFVWSKWRQKKLTDNDAVLLTTAKEKKFAEDDKKLLEEKLGRSHRQQTHTTSSTDTSFVEEKEEINGRTKNSKWTVSYGLLIHRLYEEKRKWKNEEEKVKRAKL